MDPPRKPSELIQARQAKKYNISISNKNPIPAVVDLIKGESDKTIQQCHVPFDIPLFQPEPANLTLEGFQPFKTYELVISFRNIDKVVHPITIQVPRKIRLEASTSPYFSISGWKKKTLQSDKVAPGMEVSFVVKFTPEENVDYMHEIVAITEREKFIVPIRAVGARGLPVR
jgi:hydrocephalus-inducing protein